MSAGGRRRKKKGHEEGHENSERWLLTYSDMITLLMVLFIVLFAISQVDQKKFAMLAEGLAAGFANPVAITPGNQTVLEVAADRTAIVDAQDAFPAQVKPNLAKEVAQGEAAEQAKYNSEVAAEVKKAAAAAKDKNDLDQAQKAVEEALNKAGMRDRVLLSRDGRGLTITVIVDDLVFDADRADLGSDGKRLLTVIAPALISIHHDVVVEGHTNTVNVRPKYYPSEWELSTARASTVVRYLVSPLGLDPKHLMAAGFADTRPLVPESDPRSVRLNRRVAIVVLSSLSAESGQPSLAGTGEAAPLTANGATAAADGSSTTASGGGSHG